MARGVFEASLGGGDELQRKLRAAGPLALKALGEGATKEMRRVVSDAKMKVPVDTRALKRSGTVLPPVVRGNTVTVIGGFGGEAGAYALAVHEHLSGHSPPSWVAAEASGKGVTFHPPDAGPKYLERAWLERLAYMDDNLARNVAQALEKLGA